MVKIQVWKEGQESGGWWPHEDLDEPEEQAWTKATKKVFDLNTMGEKYRAVWDMGDGLTQIYCDGFFIVPTIRYW